MSEGIVTEYPEICIFCGRQAECEHHLIFGTAGRELCEKDGLKVPACNNCHNMADKLHRIHDNPMAERLSKMLGQAVWEKAYALERFRKDEEQLHWNLGENAEKTAYDEMKGCAREARENFRKRYGKSYL